jgi:hypothetical protein
MEQKLKELKERFRKATKQQLAEIDQEMEELAMANPEDFSNAMISAAKETAVEAEELRIKEKLQKILPIVSVSYLAKTYFDKTPQWFYQRLNGNIVNGKEAKFTDQEMKILAKALKDISEKLKESSLLIA